MMNSVKLFEEFWERVWKARDPATIDDFAIDDFVITTGGLDIVFQDKVRRMGLLVVDLLEEVIAARNALVL